MIEIPPAFASGIVGMAGEAGRDWLGRLPSVIESLAERWQLQIVGAPLHGGLGIVVPVQRSGVRCALKVSWLDASTLTELASLAIWDGRGAVRLLETEPALGAMLLEWVDGGRSLQDLPVTEAGGIAAHLLRRLAVPIPNDGNYLTSEETFSGDLWPGASSFPSLAVILHLQTEAERLSETFVDRWQRLNRPFPRPFVDAASAIARELGPSADSLLVNTDLHYGNVLAGVREPWLAIDPKVVIGDPEYGIAQLLWTRLEEIEQAGGLGEFFSALVDHAALDRESARSWSLVRIVDYWLWALNVGLTEDPVRCEAITTWLRRPTH